MAETLAPSSQLDLTQEEGWVEGSPPAAVVEASSDPAQAKFMEEQPAAPVYYREVFDFDENGQKVIKQEATLKSDDIERINREAETYKFDIFGDAQEQIQQLYSGIQELGKAEEAKIRAELTEAGLMDEGSADFNEDIAIRVAAKVKEATKNNVTWTLKYPENPSKSQKREVDEKRAALEQMLSLKPDEFGSLQKDWDGYKQMKQAEQMDQLHAEAIKQDAGLNSATESRRIKSQITELEQQSGNVLAEVAKLPLDRQKIAPVLQAYNERASKIGESDNKAFLEEMNVKKALGDLSSQLREAYQAQGKSEAEIKTLIETNTPLLKTWLERGKGQDFMGSLGNFENYNRAYESWSEKRQKARDYLGESAVKSMFGRLFSRERAPKAPEIDVDRFMEAATDPAGTEAATGAEVLRGRMDGWVLMGRFINRLKTAHNLGKHQGLLMKTALYSSAMGRSMGEGTRVAWEAISDDVKEKARRKKVLGAAGVSAFFLRISRPKKNKNGDLNVAPVR